MTSAIQIIHKIHVKGYWGKSLMKYLVCYCYCLLLLLFFIFFTLFSEQCNPFLLIFFSSWFSFYLILLLLFLAIAVFWYMLKIQWLFPWEFEGPSELITHSPQENNLPFAVKLFTLVWKEIMTHKVPLGENTSPPAPFFERPRMQSQWLYCYFSSTRMN